MANYSSAYTGAQIDEKLAKVEGIEAAAQVNPTNTDYLAEGATNQYFTAERVLAAIPPSSGRKVLTASVTYYVRKDGSDSNDGLTDTAGGAFLTIQKAVNSVQALDFGGQRANLVVIQVADGIYEEELLLGPLVGFPATAGGVYPVRIVGNSANPNNVVIYPNGGYGALTVSGTAAAWRVEGFHINGARLGNYGAAILVMAGAGLSMGVYNITTNSGVYAINTFDVGSRFTAYDWLPFTLNGPCRGVIYSDGGSLVNVSFSSVTLGTLGVTESYLQAYAMSNLTYYSGSHSGVATGRKFYVDTNSLINTFGSGISYLPGSIEGVAGTASGGVYN